MNKKTFFDCLIPRRAKGSLFLIGGPLSLGVWKNCNSNNCFAFLHVVADDVPVCFPQVPLVNPHTIPCRFFFFFFEKFVNTLALLLAIEIKELSFFFPLSLFFSHPVCLFLFAFIRFSFFFPTSFSDVKSLLVHVW